MDSQESVRYPKGDSVSPFPPLTIKPFSHDYSRTVVFLSGWHAGQPFQIATFRFCTTRTWTALLRQCDVTASASKGTSHSIKRAVHVLVVQNLKVPGIILA